MYIRNLDRVNSLLVEASNRSLKLEVWNDTKNAALSASLSPVLIRHNYRKQECHANQRENLGMHRVETAPSFKFT